MPAVSVSIATRALWRLSHSAGLRRMGYRAGAVSASAEEGEVRVCGGRSRTIRPTLRRGSRLHMQQDPANYPGFRDIRRRPPAIQRSCPPHLGQVVMTMPIEGRSVEHTSETLCPCHRRHGQAVIVERGRARVRCGSPALAGMALPGSAVGRGHNRRAQPARSRQLGANTPWYRVRWARGLGTRAARRASQSCGENTMCVVPSRKGWVSSSTTRPVASTDRRSSAMAGRVT